MDTDDPKAPFRWAIVRFNPKKLSPEERAAMKGREFHVKLINQAAIHARKEAKEMGYVFVRWTWGGK